MQPGAFKADYILLKIEYGGGDRQQLAVFSQKTKGILFDIFSKTEITRPGPCGPAH